MALIKDFSTNYMKAESSIYVAKITLHLLYSVNMFIWIDRGKYITAINKKFIHFFLYLDNKDDFRLMRETILKITTFADLH